VAWQYRKDVQQERLGLSSSQNITSNSPGGSSRRSSGSSPYCHSYDLQGRLADQMKVEVTTVPMGCCDCQSLSLTRQIRGFQYYNQLLQEVEKMLNEQTSRKVIRLLLYHPDTASLVVALPLFLSHIREAKLPVVVMIAVQSWTTTSSSSDDTMQQLRHLQRSADVVLEVESFPSRRTYPPPPEFRHLHGLLKFRKASTCTLSTAVGQFAHITVQKRPAAALFGLKRDRRKLHLQLLHIPPEDYAAHGGSTSGERSGAGLPATVQTGGCSSSSGGSSTLDF